MSKLPHGIQSLILDMDGVLWTDTAPIGNLPAIFARIKEMGLGVTMATNNSTRTAEMYVDRLRSFGVSVEPWQVVTSSLAVVEMMRRQLPQGAPVFSIGEKGLNDVLRSAGFELLSTEQARKAEAVVIGLDREINFEKMREATLLVRDGKPFFATNPDRTFPTPRGQIPGAGAWIAVIEVATDIHPQYAGKPYPYILELALERLGTPKKNTLIVGDRLETDIVGAQALGFPVGVVLSGICNREQAERWQPAVDVIAEDLAAMVGVED